MSSHVCQGSRNGENMDGTMERTMLMRTQASSENELSSSIVHRKQVKPIVIDGLEDIYSVTLLVDPGSTS